LVYFLIISMQFVEWNGLIIFSSRYSWKFKQSSLCRCFKVRPCLILSMFAKMLDFFCKELPFQILWEHLVCKIDLMSVSLFFAFRYENSNLPEERIGELVTDTLGAVGLKVS
jgi:hypothetical protein